MPYLWEIGGTAEHAIYPSPLVLWSLFLRMLQREGQNLFSNFPALKQDIAQPQSDPPPHMKIFILVAGGGGWILKKCRRKIRISFVWFLRATSFIFYINLLLKRKLQKRTRIGKTLGTYVGCPRSKFPCCLIFISRILQWVSNEETLHRLVWQYWKRSSLQWEGKVNQCMKPGFNAKMSVRFCCPLGYSFFDHEKWNT